MKDVLNSEYKEIDLKILFSRNVTARLNQIWIRFFNHLGKNNFLISFCRTMANFETLKTPAFLLVISAIGCFTQVEGK